MITASFFYHPMHEVTPKVVAMAVSTVITIWMIFPQMLLLFSLLLMMVCFFDGLFFDGLFFDGLFFDGLFFCLIPLPTCHSERSLF